MAIGLRTKTLLWDFNTWKSFDRSERWPSQFPTPQMLQMYYLNQKILVESFDGIPPPFSFSTVL